MNNHQFKAVILDMDGTLVDTERVWKDAEVELLAAYGKHYDPALVDEFLGLTTQEIIAHMRTAYDLEAEDPAVLTNELYERVKRRLKTEVEVKAGTAELVSYLLARQIPVAIASNSPGDIVEATLQRQPWARGISLRCSVDQVNQGKPAPDIYLLAAERLGVTPTRCLAIEDSPGGARAAVKAGMTCFAVPDAAFTPQGAFSTITPYVYENLHEVLTILRQTIG